MRDLARDAHLVAKTLQRVRIARHGFGQELQRHRLAEHQIVGAIDLAHAALAEQRDDPIALANDACPARTARRRAM